MDLTRLKAFEFVTLVGSETRVDPPGTSRDQNANRVASVSQIGRCWWSPGRHSKVTVTTCSILIVLVSLGTTGCRPVGSSAGNSGVDPAADARRAPRAAVPYAIQVEQAIARQDWDAAQSILESAIIENPSDVKLLEQAGDIAVAKGDRAQSIELYRSALEVLSVPEVRILDKIGRQYLQLGRPFDSLALLNEMIKADPKDPRTRADIAGLYASLALEHRAAEHLQYLVQHQHAGVNELIMLTDLTRPQTDEVLCKYALRHNPDDLRPKYALARTDAYLGKWTQARESLEVVCRKHTNFADAWAYWGRTLVETANWGALPEWSKKSPPGVEQLAQYWFVLGKWLEFRGDVDGAIDAYVTGLSINPNDAEILTRLALCLGLADRSKESQQASSRAAQLNRLRDNVEALLFWRNHSQRAATKIALSMQELGRPWEAASWARSAVQMTQDPDDSAMSVFQSIREKLTGRTPWQRDDAWMQQLFATGKKPNVDWNVNEAVAAPIEDELPKDLRLVDEAAERGLHHVCAIDPSVTEDSGLWIYQSGAGGVGVLDFDLDGWPDLYLTNCDGSPKRQNSSPNRLYRSWNGFFHDVTNASAAGDLGFTQGIAVGDIDSDGFPDLYVANFGANTLFRNNGDGTFTDVTKKVGIAGDQWTTSVAIADLNGDAIADIFDVNYVHGDAVITQACFPEGKQQHRSCGPLVFPAEPDRIWLGQPDGSFVDASDEWMSSTEPGRGLGVVIGPLDAAPGNDIYVANDMTANHFWSRSGESASTTLIDQAASRGLAFNDRSLSQASMGIAAGDPDRDGDVDFYVTNFTDDYNTFYEQIAEGLWSDRTSVSSLVAPTYPLLAYGTQWIDTDGDGELELMVANGNVDDFSDIGHPFRMLPQLFHRTSTGKYKSVPAANIGEYFSRARIGRAVATADLNRDLRTDLVVTHLFDPVSILMNASGLSDASGASDGAVRAGIGFVLVGKDVHRDAVGAKLRVANKKNEWTQFQLAGHGYQCSSERTLFFQPSGSIKVEAEVTWPDGTRQRNGALETGRIYVWVQGESPSF